jgi:hypothetical protein
MGKPKIVITIEASKKKVHVPHRSGAGLHDDRRLKRVKTRQKQASRAISEYR